MKLLLVVAAILCCYEVQSVKVSVYYESLCPDSIRFITRQLNPTYVQLGDVIELDFVPYGKANHVVDPWQITCQHGRRECEGNAVQACMLARLTNNTEQEAFVNCVMGASRPDEAGSTCAETLSLNYTGVDTCATGKEGQELLAALGDRTHDFKPTITFVPTVVINDKYSQENQDLAINNFKSLICNNLSAPKPQTCSNRYYNYKPKYHLNRPRW